MDINRDLPPPYSAVAQPGVHQHYAYNQPTAPPAPVYTVPPTPIYKQPAQAPTYGATTTQTIILQPETIIVGGCPACRVGVLEDDFTCCGVMCAICFFPLGILCCLLMREKKCSNCGASF
ncbi:unnamed protein product [Brassicogethes aeneus]|uniref:Membrane protein BRI3 n=1 Tax=Brassicogethes aeneus TaxID=1431903 RepID=A0A9P0FC85_BRAAE|nr:unnamed protein product [Brassicogethes aeneus]